MLTIPAGGPGNLQAGVTGKLPIVRTLDEQADSAARKCIMYFGPNNNPRLTIGPRNQVTVSYRKFLGFSKVVTLYRLMLAARSIS